MYSLYILKYVPRRYNKQSWLGMFVSLVFISCVFFSFGVVVFLCDMPFQATHIRVLGGTCPAVVFHLREWGFKERCYGCLFSTVNSSVVNKSAVFVQPFYQIFRIFLL